MAKRTQHVWLNVWNNFVNSLKPRKISGDFKGQDIHGNKYYEIPANPSAGKRKPSRWFTPITGESGFDQEKPAEWESWLRFRRPEPPTDEELTRNQAIIHMKQKNAAELEIKYSKLRESQGRTLPKDEKGLDSFPKYKDIKPGHIGDKE